MSDVEYEFHLLAVGDVKNCEFQASRHQCCPGVPRQVSVAVDVQMLSGYHDDDHNNEDEDDDDDNHDHYSDYDDEYHYVDTMMEIM